MSPPVILFRGTKPMHGFLTLETGLKQRLVVSWVNTWGDLDWELGRRGVEK